MKMKLIAPLSSEVVPFANDPANQGFVLTEIRDQLEKLSSKGHDVDLVDGCQLSSDQAMELYLQAAEPVVTHRVDGRIRDTFGSWSSGMGPHFGREVPALILYEGERPVDIYPRVRADGSVSTIREFLAGRLE